ncbi:MAG: nucleotidyltransferase domain-containing protein [Oscillospiraceae bacterium]|nr:nucleotidyltransferase domain-containing protein [Oscillospiraceae bacterium]
MENLKIRNQKIINAIIEKANKICPESLALIGIYGSFATEDFHEKSDLDLLILINDDKGWQLSSTFIQDDLEVGHDIYCTTWENLQEASLYNDPNIAKLMDSEIVYCSDEKYMKKLETLREKAADILAMPIQKLFSVSETKFADIAIDGGKPKGSAFLQKPFSNEDYTKAENTLKEAEHFYVSAMTAEKIKDIRAQAGYVLYYIENAVAMLNKKYFRYGTKRIYEELEAMEHKPAGLCEMIESVLSANSAEQIKNALTVLMRETVRVFQSVKAAIPNQKKPTADVIGGTYEEMFSNWRNKMYCASQSRNRHLAFMSITSLNAMLSEISAETEIGDYNVFDGYDPNDLQKTAQAFDDFLKEYLNEYKKAGLEPNRFKDIDLFVKNYLEKI